MNKEKIVGFLINVCSNPLSIINQICNIKNICANSVIILHISGSCKERFLEECSKLEFDFFKRIGELNCFVNPENLMTTWGGFLAEAFISSFKFLKSLNLQIDKIVLNAANQLYFKNIENHIDNYDVGCFNFQPYKHIDFYPHDNIVNMICGDPTYWTWSYYEGLFFNAVIFEQIVNYIDFCKKNNICYTKYENGMCSPEVTFASIFNAMAMKENFKITSPMVLMHKIYLRGEVSEIDIIKDILFNNSMQLNLYNKHDKLVIVNQKFFGIKEVKLDINCQVRRYITSLFPKHKLDIL